MTSDNFASASLEKRVPAFLIDMVPAGLVQSTLMALFIMLPLAQEHIQADQVMSRNLLITAIAMIPLIFRDVCGGRSIGKRIMKLCVVSAEDPHGASFTALVIRNLFVILWPIEALLMLSGSLRLGDRVAKTKVVEMKRVA